METLDEILIFHLPRVGLQGFLRNLLGSLSKVDPSDIVFGCGEFGKPFLIRPETDLRFSIAHSGDRAVIAVTRGVDIGIDIERMRNVPHADKIVARYFSEEDRALWRRSAGESEDFLKLWTRHEALVKAMGTGLFGAPKKGRTWWARSLDLGPGLFGAVAGEGKPRRLLQINVSRANSGRVSGWSML